MPYYIYRIASSLSPEYLNQKTRFREAKELVQQLRRELLVDDTSMIRMVFADSTGEAERLLSIPKDNRIIGED